MRLSRNPRQRDPTPPKLTETTESDYFLEHYTIAAHGQVLAHDDRVVGIQIQFLVDRHRTVTAPGFDGFHTLAAGPR